LNLLLPLILQIPKRGKDIHLVMAYNEI
jgi:hypothetical protein